MAARHLGDVGAGWQRIADDGSLLLDAPAPPRLGDDVVASGSTMSRHTHGTTPVMTNRHDKTRVLSQPQDGPHRRHTIKRRTDVVAIFPNEAAIVRLVGTILLEQNDEWAASRARYMSLENLASLSDDPQARPRRIPAA